MKVEKRNPNDAMRVLVERRLEKALTTEAEIQRKASIVPDDGVKN